MRPALSSFVKFFSVIFFMFLNPKVMYLMTSISVLYLIASFPFFKHSTMSFTALVPISSGSFVIEFTRLSTIIKNIILFENFNVDVRKVRVKEDLTIELEEKQSDFEGLVL